MTWVNLKQLSNNNEHLHHLKEVFKINQNGYNILETIFIAKTLYIYQNIFFLKIKAPKQYKVKQQNVYNLLLTITHSLLNHIRSTH